MTVRIRPTGAALGADVEGADLANLDQHDFAAIRHGLQDHLVLRLRGSAIDDRDFLGLARRFGEIEPPEAHTRTAEMTVPGCPEMSIISNLIEDGIAKGEAGDGELRWHTDHGFMARPVALSMLLARAVPAAGGDTSFANMYQAYDELPAGLKARIAGLEVKHQASHSSTGQRRPGFLHLESDDPRELPGALHPIVRTHPETGKNALPRPPVRRLHSAAAARGQRGAAGSALGARHAGAARLDPALAGRRPDRLGQPLHAAPARGLRRPRPAPPAPPDDQGRPAGLAVTPRAAGRGFRPRLPHQGQDGSTA